MKRLFLIWIFSGSLDSFSQDKIDTIHIGGLKLIFRNDTLFNQFATGSISEKDLTKPDTLRAICLVTLFPNGIAHARMGFVVIEQGKRPVYLDCRKKALKIPQVGWGYEVVNPNTNQR